MKRIHPLNLLSQKLRSKGFGLYLLIGVGIIIGGCQGLTLHQATYYQPLRPVADATFVGNQACVECHQAEHRYFNHSDHWGVAIETSEAQANAGVVESCESCHGAGSLHVEDSLRSTIVRGSAESCFTCHLDVKGEFLLQHRHPVMEGRMGCADCHNLHGSDVLATGGQMMASNDESCFTCHTELRGPFVFEHDAMREGCQTCHNVHGSTSDKLLVAGQTTTCIRCHWETSFSEAPDGNLGNVIHGGFSIGQGEECIDHHRAPHGSNIWRTFNR